MEDDRIGVGVLYACDDSPLMHQVEDLTNLLHRTNQTMAENEDKLAYFHDITRSKSRQLKKVCGVVVV